MFLFNYISRQSKTASALNRKELAYKKLYQNNNGKNILFRLKSTSINTFPNLKGESS